MAVVIHPGWAFRKISFSSKTSVVSESLYITEATELLAALRNYHSYCKKKLKSSLPYNNLVILASLSSSILDKIMIYPVHQNFIFDHVICCQPKHQTKADFNILPFNFWPKYIFDASLS